MSNFYIKKGNQYLSENLRFYEGKSNAMVFNSEAKAYKVLTKNVSRKDRGGCSIIEDKGVKSLSFKKKTENFAVIYREESDLSSEVISAIEKKEILEHSLNETEVSLVVMRSKIEKRNKDLSSEISIMDKEVVDIIHFIEFNEFSKDTGYEAYKLLHNKTNERRKLKDEKAELDLLIDILNGTKTPESYNKYLQKKQSPIYTPRALPELFKEVV